jgi:hypothetical protein
MKFWKDGARGFGRGTPRGFSDGRLFHAAGEGGLVYLDPRDEIFFSE